MRVLLTSLTIFMAILAFASLGWETPASADNYICPNGPGPGEVQVGTTNGGNSGVAPMPVCESSGSGPGSGGGSATRPARPYVPVKDYFAGAWHPNARDAWIVSGYRTAANAETAAMEACFQTMGKGCTVGFSGYNQTIALARGTRGELYSATDVNAKLAEKRVKDYCRTQGDDCQVVRVLKITSPGKAEMYMTFPENPKMSAPTGNPRRVYGAVAWIDGKQKGKNPWVGDAWVATGRASADAAKADALAACKRDMPTPCEVALVASDVTAVFVANGIGGVSVTTSASPAYAKKLALADCKASQKGKCRLLKVVDFGQPASFRIPVPSAAQ